MNETVRYIAIEGPIGVGKSSLTGLLGERFGVDPVYEPVDSNPYLSNFYENKKQYAFEAQMFFLVNRYKQLSGLSQGDLFNKVILCDYVIERDYNFAKLNLTEHEFRIYVEIYRQFIREIPSPDLIVYLQADTSVLMKRIRKRDREIEKTITEEYLSEVNRTFNEFFFNYRQCPVLIINTNNIDFVANKTDFESLAVKVCSDVIGLEFFNPPATQF